MQLPALVFNKEGHCIVKLVRFIKRSEPISWQAITPQLMGRAVGRKLEHRLRRAARRLEGGD